jgi:hypothetical protein
MLNQKVEDLILKPDHKSGTDMLSEQGKNNESEAVRSSGNQQSQTAIQNQMRLFLHILKNTQENHSKHS